MAIDIRAGLGGGDELKPEFYSGVLQHSLGPVTPLTINPPSGKRLKLVGLIANPAVPDVTVTVDTVSIVSGLELGVSPSNAGQFAISDGAASQAGAAGVLGSLVTITDGEVEISKSSAGTLTITYSYAYGD